MATTFLNTKIIEVENKSPDASGLATTAFIMQKLEKLKIKLLIMINILLLLNLMN